MDRSLKVRFALLLGSIALCVGVLLPNFVPIAKDSYYPWKKPINLGLDLQGGLHLVYSIDLDRAVADKALEIKRDLESRFLDEKIKATVRTVDSPNGGVVVLFDASLVEAKRNEIKSFIKSDHSEEISDRACTAGDTKEIKDAYCFRVSSDFADELKKSALESAVNTIRDRIDVLGVAEPSVVVKGDDIVVELPGLVEKKKKATPTTPAAPGAGSTPGATPTPGSAPTAGATPAPAAGSTSEPDSESFIEQARSAVKRAAKLEFKVVAENTPYMNAVYFRTTQKDGSPSDEVTDPLAKKEGILADIDTWRPEEGNKQYKDPYLAAYDRREAVSLDFAKKIECPEARELVNVRPDGLVECNVKGRHVIDRYLDALKAEDPSKFTLDEKYVVAYEHADPQPGSKEKRKSWRTYILEREVRLTGTSISNAMGSYDPNTNRPIVLLDFNRYGSRVFGDLTAQITGRKLATILDDEVKSAPIINGAIRGGRASITMGGSDARQQETERNMLVNVLKTGSLPAPLREESASVIGPTLGMDAIQKTRFSFALAVLLVFVIMLAIYRWSGWIAVICVLYHVLLTIAVMALFGATLTLPGIAAVVLSVGMTVDGNILIYERIRDELNLGKSVRGAIDVGFSRAFSAILDGQLTTAAGGWVLLQYGSGPIKGFAVMLLVGVFTTLLVNTWLTRIFFDWIIARKKGTHTTLSI